MYIVYNTVHNTSLASQYTQTSTLLYQYTHQCTVYPCMKSPLQANILTPAIPVCPYNVYIVQLYTIGTLQANILKPVLVLCYTMVPLSPYNVYIVAQLYTSLASQYTHTNTSILCVVDVKYLQHYLLYWS